MLKKIAVKFKDRDETIIFTPAVLDLCRTDPATEWIIDAETGEVIFSR